MDKTGYIRELAREGDSVEAESRIQNLQELISVTRNFERGRESSSLSDFLQEVALLSDIDALEDDNNGVTLMTLHSAKGLEFPVVFMVGMDEGVFPLARSIFESGEVEEERRLCYVGITRARDRLFLVSADFRMLYGSASANPPSRFIGELPAELVQQVGRAALGASPILPVQLPRFQDLVPQVLTQTQTANPASLKDSTCQQEARCGMRSLGSAQLCLSQKAQATGL